MFGDLLRVLRPWQWYKNLAVFLALFFSGNLFDFFLVQYSALAFASLCALSSATYIFNDIADRHRDRLNAEKKHRPIAAGRVRVWFAILLAVVLSAAGFGIAAFLPSSFLYATLSLFSLSQIYTIWLKHEPFADILAVATNFVLRAVAGAFAIGVWVSPWLVAGVFFFALFLVLGKRRGELHDRKSLSHRPVLRFYCSDISKNLAVIVTASLIISYALFVFFGGHTCMFLTLPVVVYAIFRYEYLIQIGSSIARHPHRTFADLKLVMSMLLWCCITFLVLYYRFVPK